MLGFELAVTTGGVKSNMLSGMNCCISGTGCVGKQSIIGEASVYATINKD